MAVRPHTTASTTATQAAATDQRSGRLCTTRPMTWNCIGMKYFDWSSSRKYPL